MGAREDKATETLSRLVADFEAGGEIETCEFENALVSGGDPNVMVGVFPALYRLVGGSFDPDGNGVDLIRFILEHGADPNWGKHRSGMTAIFLAVDKGNTSMVNLLIDHDADLDHQTPMGSTPLLIAADNLSFEMVDLLIARGCHVDERVFTLLEKPDIPPAKGKEMADFIRQRADERALTQVSADLEKKTKSTRFEGGL